MVGAAVIDDHDFVSDGDRELLTRANTLGDADRDPHRPCESRLDRANGGGIAIPVRRLRCSPSRSEKTPAIEHDRLQGSCSKLAHREELALPDGHNQFSEAIQGVRFVNSIEAVRQEPTAPA
jgi:hypothetical protein